MNQRKRAQAEPSTGKSANRTGGPRRPLTPAGDADAAMVLKQFRIIFRSVKKHFQVIERTCGIGGSQLWALATVVSNPGIRVSELAQALSVHQSTASNLVEQMVRLGLLVRERDESDQRVVHLKASERGAEMVARAPGPLTGLLPDALAQMSAEETRQLQASLAKLLDLMELRDESATLTPLADI
jgi:DNA-binding MarR family transcriptional regulator